MKTFFYILFFLCCVSCIPSGEEVISLNNTNFTNLRFSRSLSSSDSVSKIIATHNSNDVSLKVWKVNHEFHVKVRRKQSLLSKRKFKLFPVNDSIEFKVYANHNLFQAALTRESLLGLKSKFVNVKVNDDESCFFFQENFDKIFIESNRLREGIVFTYFERLKIKKKLKGKAQNIAEASLRKKLSKWENDERNTAVVFDVEKIAMFFAVKKSFALEDLNLGYYLNPVSNLIEAFSFTGKREEGKLEALLLNDTMIQGKIVQYQQELVKKNGVVSLTKNHSLFKYLALSQENVDYKSTADTIKVIRDQGSKYSKYFHFENGVYTLKNGMSTLSEALFIPSNGKVVLVKGDRINLVNGAFIVSYSPVEFKGEQKFPIVIESTDSSGQGLHVIQSQGRSVLEHVSFSSLRSLNYKGWSLPSAVTFYESPVIINNCNFAGNLSEDALNLFRSEFVFENSIIKNTLSDALDIDFSTGTVKNSKFINVGNDGVDVSGSKVNVQGSYFDKIQDKAISAGEASELVVDSVTINNISIAITSKDLSSVQVKNSTIKNSEVLYLIFQKKPEYGPGKIVVDNVVSSIFKEEDLLEEGSTLIIDGEKRHNYRSNVKKYLYGNEYGKKTVR